jgi:hypothetical protein
MPNRSRENESLRMVARRPLPRPSWLAGSDDETLLRKRLGPMPTDGTDVPWTLRYTAIRPLVGIVQPGLSAATLRADLAASPVPPGAQSLQELFSVMADTAIADGAELVLVVSA